MEALQTGRAWSVTLLALKGAEAVRFQFPKHIKVDRTRMDLWDWHATLFLGNLHENMDPTRFCLSILCISYSCALIWMNGRPIWTKALRCLTMKSRTLLIQREFHEPFITPVRLLPMCVPTWNDKPPLCKPEKWKDANSENVKVD